MKSLLLGALLVLPTAVLSLTIVDLCPVVICPTGQQCRNMTKGPVCEDPAGVRRGPRDPCRRLNCRDGKECRIQVKGSRSKLKKVCVSTDLSKNLTSSGACVRPDLDILKKNNNSELEILLCGADNPCPRGAYCSSASTDNSPSCCWTPYTMRKIKKPRNPKKGPNKRGLKGGKDVGKKGRKNKGGRKEGKKGGRKNGKKGGRKNGKKGGRKNGKKGGRKNGKKGGRKNGKKGGRKGRKKKGGKKGGNNEPRTGGRQRRGHKEDHKDRQLISCKNVKCASGRVCRLMAKGSRRKMTLSPICLTTKDSDMTNPKGICRKGYPVVTKINRGYEMLKCRSNSKSKSERCPKRRGCRRGKKGTSTYCCP